MMIPNTWIVDLRSARRALTRRPAVTLAAILTLALGIGANTVIFTVVEGVVIHPLPYEDAEELVYLREIFYQQGMQLTTNFDPETVRDLEENARSFEQIEAYASATPGSGRHRLTGSAGGAARAAPGLALRINDRPDRGQFFAVVATPE